MEPCSTFVLAPLTTSYTGLLRYSAPSSSECFLIVKISVGVFEPFRAGQSFLPWFGSSTYGLIFIRGEPITHRFPCTQKSRLSRGYTRENLPLQLDIHDRGYTPRIWLYIFCGLLDAIWQVTAYWLMGAMSNDPVKLAHFTGLCPYKFSFPIST
jgi:hypothetical protein